MPKRKSKRRKSPPARSGSRRDTEVGTLTRSPAKTWRAAQDLGAPAGALTVLEVWPFVLNEGGPVTMRQIAAEANQTLPQAVEGLLALEDMGALRWDGTRNTYWQTAPSRMV